MKKKVFICGIILSLVLSGCGFQLIEHGDEAWMYGNKNEKQTETSTEKVTETSVSVSETSVSSDNGTDNSHTVDIGETDIPEGCIGVKLNDQVFVGETDTTRYYRTQLSSEEQRVYDELYVVIQNMLGEAEVSTLDASLLEKVQKAVVNDFPEFFYYSNYQFMQYTINDQIQKLTFVANYTMSSELRDKYQEGIDSYVETFMSGCHSGMGDYDIALSLYEFIAYNTEYVYGCPENQNILSVIWYGESVCSGYAKTYQYIMNRLGYETVLVTGNSLRTNELHAWLIVKLDGDYYYIDPTWGDSAAEGIDKTYVNPMTVNYGFFCVPDAWLSRTHVNDNFLPTPSCTATADHYYIKNNAYITNKDESEFKRIYNASVLNSNIVSFRCDNEELFNYWIKHLFDEQGIFNYLQAGQTLSYTYNDETLVISILLN